MASCKHMCAEAHARKSADAILLFWIEIPQSQFRAAVRISGILPRSGMRFLNFAWPREIEESRSKKVVLHQHSYERVRYRAHMLTQGQGTDMVIYLNLILKF